MADVIRLDQNWRLDAGHRFDLPPQTPQGGGAGGTKPNKNRKTMDYIPSKRADLKDWCLNFRDEVEDAAVAAGIPAADATAAKALAGDLYNAFGETDAAESALGGKRTAERNVVKTRLAQLRAKVKNWKTLPGYAASGIEGTLGLKGAAVEFDPDTYKADFTVRWENGMARFDFLLLGADAVAVYCRPRGGTVWTRIGVDTDPPYFDSKPVTTPGVPEARQYLMRGMVGDAEIGVDSDIVEFVLPG